MTHIRFLSSDTPPHTFTLILTSAIAALSMNLFLPSLPAMAAYFEAPYGVVQLSVALYLVITAIFQLFIGPLSDRHGRRKVMLWSIVIFAIASLGATLSTHIIPFLIFRMCQGAIVTGMVLSRAIVRDLYDTEKAASMVGYVTMGQAVAPMFAPAIGGQLQAHFGWQANFAALTFLGIFLFWLVRQDLGETKPAGAGQGRSFDNIATLFKSQRFWGYVLASGLSAGAFFTYLGSAPFIGSELYGLSPERLGAYFGAPAIGYFLGNFISGLYAARIGINRMVMTGSTVVTLGCGASLLLFKLGYGSVESFFAFVTCVGLGNGLSIPSATSGALSVRPDLAGTASGLGGSIMIFIGAALSSLAGALLSHETGPFPALWLMFLCGVGSVIATSFVLWRAHEIKRGA
ncbi:MAG: multidrug effflux MFS transporter [Halocynthiibacter sp.]